MQGLKIFLMSSFNYNNFYTGTYCWLVQNKSVIKTQVEVEWLKSNWLNI